MSQVPQSSPNSDSPSTHSTGEFNRRLAIRWFHEVWNDRRDETVREIMHPDCVAHMEGGEGRGPSDFLTARASLLEAFPNVSVTVDDTAADGDRVVVRWSATGRHTGSGLGIAATSKDVSFRGMTWMTFREGLVVEGWDAWNLGGLMEGLKTP